MIRGLYTSGIGMTTEMKKLDVISNNLANVNTTGFKQDNTVISAFPEVLLSKINDRQVNNLNTVTPMGPATLGVQIDHVYTKFEQGSFVRTDDNLHLAIQGDGFFTIRPEGSNELRYTRDGSFVLDEQGNLRTNDGSLVMGQNGNIRLGDEFLTMSKELSISDNGVITLDGEYLDTINLVSFDDLTTLRKVGDNEYTATEQPQRFNGKIIQGFLENSNVNPVRAMVDLITVSRAYEANQKVIQTHDSLLAKAANEVGKA